MYIAAARMQSADGVGFGGGDGVGGLLRAVAAQDRGEDVDRRRWMGRLREDDAVRVGFGGGEVEVVGGAAAGECDVELLAVEPVGADDVAGVGGDALGGVDGARVAEGGVGGDVVGGQAAPCGFAGSRSARRSASRRVHGADRPAVTVLHPAATFEAQTAGRCVGW